MSVADWPGEFDTRAILLESHYAMGALDRATLQARKLVALKPANADARWALVNCLLSQGDVAGAWSALTLDGAPLPPRDGPDAQNWIVLSAKFDDSPQFVTRALNTMRRWPNDEELQGRFIANIYFGLTLVALTLPIRKISQPSTP